MSKKKQDPAKEAAVQSEVSKAEAVEQSEDSAENTQKISVEEVLHPTNPENSIVEIDESSPDASLRSTGEVSVDAQFEDSQVLSRLRASLLTPTEIFHEAQLFAAQNLDVSSLLRSRECVLVQNTIEILRTLDIYQSAAISALLLDESDAHEYASRYLIHCLKRELVSVQELVEDFMAISVGHESCAGISLFADKLSGILISAMFQQQFDIAQCQNSLTRICGLLDKNVVSRLLYDPSPLVRVAVIRSFLARTQIDINDLSVALILLKDKDENVNIALMRMFSRFATCPELVIPQVLALLGDASDALREEILGLIRCYDNDAVDPVIHALESIQDGMFEAVRSVIANCPQRYTDALLKTLSAVRTSDLVRGRLITILSSHKDPSRQAEIYAAVKAYTAPDDGDLPEWVPPAKDDMFLPRATDNADIYDRILDDREIAAISASCTDDVIYRLLGDASSIVIINALHIISHQKRVSEANASIIRVWMKSSVVELASAALDTMLTLEKDDDKIAHLIVETFVHCESDEVKRNFFDVMNQHQNSIDALIRAFYQMPRKCAGFIMKFLAMNPNDETLKSILAGLNRDQSVACISETMQCLIKTKFKFENHGIRALIMSHVVEPISFGQQGLMTRIFGLKLLRKFMMEDEQPDKAMISALQAFYKEGKNAELKKMTKDLLKDLNEEIFDFDDEEDDFEDLNDDEDED